MKKIVILFIMLSSIFAKAQNDLLSLLGSAEPMYITSTFKGKKIVNGQSVEILSKGVLQFQIQHRFGTLNSGFYNLFGLDNSQIRLGFDYGIKDWMSIGIGRSSALKTIDASAKLRLKRQSKGSKEFPFTLVTNSAIFVKQYRWSETKEETFELNNQLSFAHQILIARKINRDLTIQLSPTVVHYNLVETENELNDKYAIGIGGRQKLTKRVSLNAEYFYQLNDKIYNNVFHSGK